MMRPLVWDVYQILPAPVRSCVVRMRHKTIWDSVPTDMRILFIHVPKTGGTTLTNALYGTWVNHYPLWVWRDADVARFAHCTPITVLREPLDRLVSAIRHCLGNEQASAGDQDVGRFLRANARDLHDMIDLYLWDPAARGRVAWNHLFRPYDYWLGKRDETPALRCFALVRSDVQPASARPRLNVNTVAERVGELTGRQREKAREVLASDYRWYDDPRNDRFVDVNDIVARMADARCSLH